MGLCNLRLSVVFHTMNFGHIRYKKHMENAFVYRRFQKTTTPAQIGRFKTHATLINHLLATYNQQTKHVLGETKLKLQRILQSCPEPYLTKFPALTQNQNVYPIIHLSTQGALV